MRTLRTGAPWRDLPERFGNWNSAWRRFDRWSKSGLWLRLFEATQEADMEWVMIDATVVRARQHAAGARKMGIRPTSPPPARGSGAAGASSKIHTACDALGNPLRLALTPGQRGDMTQASALIDGMADGAVIGDKG